MTLQELIDAILAVDPDAPALEFERRWTTWRELAGAKAALVDAIGGLDHPPGLRIGVLLRNRAELVAPILAAVTSDACLVTINAAYPDAHLAADLSAHCPPVLVGASVDWAREGLRAAAEKAGALMLAVTGDRAVPLAVVGGAARTPDGSASRPGVAVEMLTSGTTGPPKRVPLTRAMFTRAVLDAALFEAGRDADAGPRLRGGTQLLTAPFAHIGGLLALLNAITAGRKACILEKFTVDEFHDALKRHRPKVVSTPPAALKMLLDAKLPREDFASLAAYRTGTAPLDPDLADSFYRAYGVPVLQNYGATEFGGVAGWTLKDFHAFSQTKRGAVGRLNPGVEGRVVDPHDGEPRPAGEEGVLELRGVQIGDGASWLRTTDLAIIDADRFLWIKGRADNVIIRGGFKIQPDDVAAAIEMHEAIAAAAVTGLPDVRLGQVPVAAYVVRDRAVAPSEDELRAFLRDRLLAYQVPVKFRAVAELPRTVSMKVSQPALRALFEPADGE